MEKVFDKVRIGNRLLLLVTIMVMAMVFIGLVGFLGIQKSNENMDSMYSQNFEAYQLLVRLRDGLRQTRISAGDLLVETDSAELNKLAEHIRSNGETTNELIDSFRQLEVSSEVERIFEEGVTNLAEYRLLRNEAVEMALNGESDKASVMIQNAQPLLDEIVDTIDNLAINERNEMGEFYKSSHDSFVNAIINLIVVFFVALVITIIFSLLISRSITQPINTLKVKLSQIASGDLTVEVPNGYKAEFGEMFDSFRDMLGNLNTLILGTKRTSENVRDSFIDVKGEVGEISESITEMDSFLNILATDMDNQVSGIKESSAAMDSIASGIQQIAESSTSVAELAAETSTQANDGGAVIEKSVMQMETINQVVNDTSSVVDRLVKRTKTIDEALKAITNIAEQTNLLALNASIEAARAGEQGRGFAVVADEVSKLAAQSKESANEINVLLQEIHEDTEEAIRTMELGKMESKQGIAVIHQAGQAFSSIIEQVTIMTEQVQEVSATVEEMSAGTEEVNSSLSEVVRSSEVISSKTMEVVQKNNTQVEVVNKIVNVMSETKEDVERLEEDLNEFKTESEGNRG